MAVTEQSYLDNSSSVKAARKKLDAAKAELALAKQASERLPDSVGAQGRQQVASRLADAQAAFDKAAGDVAAVETKAKAYFAKNETAINAKQSAKEASTKADNIARLTSQLEAMKNAGLDTTQVQRALDKLTKPAESFKESPKPGAVISGSGTTQVDDFSGLFKDARAGIKGMSPAERLSLAKDLNSINIKVPLSGEFTDLLVQGYQSLVTGAQNYYKQYKEFPTVDSYLAEMKRQYAITNPTTGGTGAGGAANLPWATIYSDSQAAKAINDSYNAILKRDATPQEIKKLTPLLQKAQQDNPSKRKVVNGVEQTILGLNVDQWLEDQVKALPEFSTKKESANKTTMSAILGTAMDNNLKPSPTQLASWTQRVKNGENVADIQNEIRLAASTGYSDQIKKLMASGTDLSAIMYPYKQAMATTLQINPNTISLNDPVLNQAISTPDGKEMTLYQYQTALRKDPRWQYTDQARSEAADVATKVLKDFGFMG